MKTPGNTVRALLVMALGVLPGVDAQTQLSTDHFDGWETWPLRAPGDLVLDTDRLVPLRIEFDGRFPGSRGFAELSETTMFMDLIEVNFRGRPAIWVQWTSSATPGDENAATALDMLVVDRETFALNFRIARSGPLGEWAGPHQILHVQPDRITQIGVNDDGTTSTDTVALNQPVFDFATYQFLFPLLELETGMKFRMSGYGYGRRVLQDIPVLVRGRTTVQDAAGRDHDVWDVQVYGSAGGTLINFYLSDEPPFFKGWRYRRVSDGATLTAMTYRGWTPTAVRPTRGDGAVRDGEPESDTAHPVSALAPLIGTWTVHPHPDSAASGRVTFSYDMNEKVVRKRMVPLRGTGEQTGIIGFDPSGDRLVGVDFQTMIWGEGREVHLQFQSEYFPAGGVVRRLYSVRYPPGEPLMPLPNEGGTVRRFRETYVLADPDTIEWRTEILDRGEWKPFGRGGTSTLRRRR